MAPTGLAVTDVVLVAGCVGLIVHGLNVRIAEDLARARDVRLRAALDRDRARLVRRVEGPVRS